MTKRTKLAAPLFALYALGASLPVSAQEAPPAEAVESVPAPKSVEKKGERVEGEVLEVIRPDIPTPDPDAPRLINWREARPNQADYPAKAWLEGAEGTVGYQINVDAEGKATRCFVDSSSGEPALDKATCAILMARAQFEPRRNEQGEAVAGIYKRGHRWRIREPEVPGTFRFEATFVLDETGRARDCEVSALDGSLPDELRRMAEKNACPFGQRRATAPYRDENGVPIAKRVTVKFAAQVSDVEPKAED